MNARDSLRIDSDESRTRAIDRFVGLSPQYYRRVFHRLDEHVGFALSFNLPAAMLGPLWWGFRHLWMQFWVFLFLETLAIVQVSRGLLADLGAERFARADRLSGHAAARLEEAREAASQGADNADVLMESAKALAAASEKALAQAEELAAQGPFLVVIGIAMLIAVKLAGGLLANRALKARFQKWRADQGLESGVDYLQGTLMGCFALLAAASCAYRFTVTEVPGWLRGVPVDPQWRRNAETWVDDGFQWLTESFSGFFGGITRMIRLLLDGMEVVMVGTPWPIMMIAIVFLAHRLAGFRVALFTAVALAYLGILGFWEQSMLTIALLGSACLVCLVLGIPLGIVCARRRRVRNIVWPVLDLMQTMPSFVYLIPVIAFFGIGKPPGIIATIVFGMPPVVRLTVLGLQGVSPYVREAAEAFGASKQYLLFRVDLPLAKPSIMTGVNQTILMCLSMVVIASLIGAKGLGEAVLDALTYANEGKGVLAGIAILFCAMILDRIVQGRQRTGRSNRT